MTIYKIKTKNGSYDLKAEDVSELRKLILEKEEISFEEVNPPLLSDTLGKLIYLEQDDPRWKDDKLGQSNATIGRYGCTITCLSMASHWYGYYLKPWELAKKLRFTSEGLLYWDSMNDVCPFTFVWRYYTRNVAKLFEIISSRDNACILEVKAFGARHWLFALSYNNGRFYAIDPLTATIVDVEAKYGAIVGFTEVKRK